MEERKDEVCDGCEVHEDLLKIVNETLPEETELYDLAELFKVFGDSTRIRIRGFQPRYGDFQNRFQPRSPL